MPGTWSMGSAKRGRSPARRSTSSSAAGGGEGELAPLARRRVPARRLSHELRRGETGAGDRPARARQQEPRRHQRVPDARLEVRRSRGAGGRGEGRRPVAWFGAWSGLGAAWAAAFGAIAVL